MGLQDKHPKGQQVVEVVQGDHHWNKLVHHKRHPLEALMHLKNNLLLHARAAQMGQGHHCYICMQQAQTH